MLRATRTVHVVSCHAEGEVGDVVVGGVAPPPGDTLWAQARWIAADGGLRDFLLNEPRGGVFRHVNLLVPPKHPGATAGFIIMEPEHTPPMSGSNAICVATVLLDTGMLAIEEPETRFLLEAPAGPVAVRAFCENGKARAIEIENVPAFADRLDVPLDVEGLGSLVVDTAWGGDSFVLVDAGALGFALVPEEAGELAKLGARITAEANRQIGFRHPDLPDWRHISFCQFTLPAEAGPDGGLVGRNTVAIDPGKLDRSPTGTGCSARMAVLNARGQLAIGTPFTGRSILDSRFECSLAGETRLSDGRPAVIPRLRGRAWITGLHQHMLDPDDPWPGGYRLSDTWPVMPEAR